MITAKEALLASKKTQIDFIENQIQGAINKGLYEVSFQKDITEENKNLLKESGFVVNETKLTDGSAYTINWENA